MRHLKSPLLLSALILLTLRPAAAQSHTEEREAVNETLDLLHEKAASADFEGYFSLYDDAAIFLGTDASERWTMDEFKDYTRPVFARGRGWTYNPVSRNIYVSEDGNTAWFDETLENESLGETRGTGVLIQRGGDWKIVQYNLTLPIPNQLAREFVARIRSLEDGE
jgi:hypothetical protein